MTRDSDLAFGWKEGLQISKSSTTTAKGALLPNPTPGEILQEEFLKPMELSQSALARAIRVAPPPSHQ